MSGLPPRLGRVLVALSGLALACVAFTLWYYPHAWDGRIALESLLLGALLLGARLAPLPLLARSKFFVATAPLFLAVLCLPSAATLGITVAAYAAASLLRRRPWFETLANTALAVVQVTAADLAFALITG